MFTVSSASYIAKSQLAYHEGQTGGHWNNDQKYSDQLPGFKWSDGQPWCCTFVHWCLWQVGVPVPAGAQSASCATSCAAYKNAGRFTEYPVLGAQAFYGPHGGSHTGLVVAYDDTWITTVEGNTNTTGSSEGDGVYQKQRRRRDAYVYGYGVPYYHGVGQSPDPKWNGRDLSKR